MFMFWIGVVTCPAVVIIVVISTLMYIHEIILSNTFSTYSSVDDLPYRTYGSDRSYKNQPDNYRKKIK